jgi:glucose-1-phosphate adenylyltransferase
MGIYVFTTEYLRDRLLEDAEDESSTHDFGRDLIPHIIEHANAFAFPFVNANTGAPGYWRDVGTVDAYWDANVNLVTLNPELNMYDADWPIWTHQEQLAPAKFAFDDDDRRGYAVDSLISGGCLITGAIIRKSVLFSNVRVHSYSTVEDSVVLPDVTIERHCKLSRCVIDKGAIIPKGTVIGEHPEEDARRFYVTENGIVLVTAEMLGQELHRM